MTKVRVRTKKWLVLVLNDNDRAKLAVMQQLLKAQHAFNGFNRNVLQRFGLTVPQADVVFSLGNSEGMGFKQLGEQTQISKGTLTGVVDRLEEQGYVQRVGSSLDGRCCMVELTPAGRKTYQKIFPDYAARIGAKLQQLDALEIQVIDSALQRLTEIFKSS